MTYEQLCPPGGLGDGICVRYFFHVMTPEKLLLAIIALVILGVFVAWLEAQKIGIDDVVMLLLCPLLIGPALVSYLWRKWNKWPQPISDKPDYIRQIAPDLVVFGYKGRGYDGGVFAKEDVYRIEKVEEPHLLGTPPRGPESYVSAFGWVHLLQSGRLRLTLKPLEYSKEDLYRLARWLDAVERDLSAPEEAEALERIKTNVLDSIQSEGN